MLQIAAIVYEARWAILSLTPTLGFGFLRRPTSCIPAVVSQWERELRELFERHRARTQRLDCSDGAPA